MAKEGSVAPKERINIRYVPATLGQQAEIELPLRLMVLGDFLGKEDGTPLEDRKTLSVDKNTFATVMEEAGLERQFVAKNALSDEDENDLRVSLKFKSLKDFEPDSIVRQVPELKKLIELREALVALKGPLGNMPAFRRRLQTLLSDEASRQALLKELDGVAPASKPASIHRSKKSHTEDQPLPEAKAS
jgi:type VI secretion system protein ImpB